MLPDINTLENYRPVYRKLDIWLPALRAICARHKLNAATLSFAPPGSNIVCWVEDHWLIKLFPPFWGDDCAREQRSLEWITAHGTLEVPRIHSAGEIEGWRYLVLSRLEGKGLDEIWPLLDIAGRTCVAAGLGRMMAALHRISPAGLSLPGPDWSSFLRAQMEGLLQRQREAGAAPHWLEDIAAYYAALPSLHPNDFLPVLVNADLNPEHIFCRETAKGWEVFGMIDFGDAILGHPEYEFVAPGFLLAGQPNLRRTMLMAYGYDPAALDEALSKRLTAYILLHRFIDIVQVQAMFPEPPQNMRALQVLFGSF